MQLSDLVSDSAQERHQLDGRRPHGRAGRVFRCRHHKAANIASPILAQHCAMGKTIPKAKH
jgi:type VI protein secretion system component Hcp